MALHVRDYEKCGLMMRCAPGFVERMLSRDLT
jgi:hypothetical protein